MEFQDKSLVCADCGQDFLFTAGEQEFYERKGFREIPKRCKPCRDARKQRRPDGGANGNSGNGTRGEVDGNRSPRELHDATCASCGVQTRVPFRPSPGRPVYCRDCYANQRGAGAR
jgi:CxxC-x17-CxxC domain-containing protein